MIEAGYEAGCYRYRFAGDKPVLRFNAWLTRFKPLLFRGGDQTLFITRSLFKQVGGFNQRFVVMEDYEIIRTIRRQARFGIIPKNALVSAGAIKSNRR